MDKHLETVPRVRANTGSSARCAPPFDRVSTLRILARLASYCVEEVDVLPLDISCLSGDRGARIVKCMRSIAAQGRPVVDRVRGLASALIKHSRLGYALRDLPSPLLDHVLGWAAVNRRAEKPEFLREVMETLARLKILWG